MIARLLAALFTWAARRRDAAVTAALDPRRPGPWDHELDAMLRESFD